MTRDAGDSGDFLTLPRHFADFVANKRLLWIAPWTALAPSLDGACTELARSLDGPSPSLRLRGCNFLSIANCSFFKPSFFKPYFLKTGFLSRLGSRFSGSGLERPERNQSVYRFLFATSIANPLIVLFPECFAARGPATQAHLLAIIQSLEAQTSGRREGPS